MADYNAREQFLSVDIGSVYDFAKALKRADRDLAKEYRRAVAGLGREIRDDARASHKRAYPGRSSRSTRTRAGITGGERSGLPVVALNRTKRRDWLPLQEFSDKAPQFRGQHADAAERRQASRLTAAGIKHRNPGRFFWGPVKLGQVELADRLETVVDETVDKLADRGRPPRTD